MKLANAVYVFALSVGVIAQQKTLKIDGAAINADIDTGVMTIGYFDCMIVEDHLPFQIELKAEDFEMMDGLSFLPVSGIKYNPPWKTVDISVARNGPLPRIVDHDGPAGSVEEVMERSNPDAKYFELDKPFELTVQYNDHNAIYVGQISISAEELEPRGYFFGTYAAAFEFPLVKIR